MATIATTDQGLTYSIDPVELVFRGNPDNPDMLFVETEDGAGKSISLGEWTKRDDGYWVLRFDRAVVQPSPERVLTGTDRAERSQS